MRPFGYAYADLRQGTAGPRPGGALLIEARNEQPLRVVVHATNIGVSRAPAGTTGDELLVIPFYEGATGPEPGPGAVAAGQAVGVDLADGLARDGFRGGAGESAVYLVPGWSPGDPGPRRIAVMGIGPLAGANAATVRHGAQRLASIAAGSATVATTLAVVGPDRAESVRALAEGFLLGGYRVPRAGSHPIVGEPPAFPSKLTLLVGDVVRSGSDGDRDGRLADALARAVVTGQIVNWVRDLVHAPAAEATPDMLAEVIAAAAVAHGAAARIWTADELAEEGFGGVIGVGQGSRNTPRMLEITYAGPGDPGGLVGLAGKGITFDSGGLNLKRDPGEISWMRADMAGGAAVAGAVIAAARLALPLTATAVVPLAENLPGGGALRPGDVLTHRGGRTSEVIDTDSEGRLVVADALAYLAERNPAALIDVATLTDAAGLGPALWAAMGTDRTLLDEILLAGDRAGEPGWPLPLPEAYRQLLSSSAADLRNTPTRGPDSTVMAATFLREFTGETPWVHIDNGSTAWLEYESGLWPEGATGSPVRTLIRFLERRATGVPATKLCEQAGDCAGRIGAPGRDLQRRVGVRASVLGDRATGPEPAAWRDVDRVGGLAGEDLRPGPFAWVAFGHHREQRLGVGMLRVANYLPGRALLDNSPEIHNGDPIGEMGRCRQVVGDHQDPHLAVPAQSVQQRKDARSDRDVQHRHWLVRQ